MRNPRPTRRARVLGAALALLPLLAAACTDRPDNGPAGSAPKPEKPLGTIATLNCSATPATGQLSCDPPAEAGELRTLGGQGVYVRVASSNITYVGSEFSFDVTVQNLATAHMGTADGTARHEDGVRVFFGTAPTTVTGTGDIGVLNATGTSTFTASNQRYYQYGGAIGGTDQAELGADGMLATGEVSSAKRWSFSVPNTVQSFAFVLFVSTEMAPGPVQSAAPAVATVSPSPLVPGATATISGARFNATPGSNTVTIGGVAATVTAATADQLTVTVPCVSSGNLPVQVTSSGMKGVAVSHPLQVTQRTMEVGQAAILENAADVGCNELPAVGGAARYVVAVYNASATPTNQVAVQISGDATGTAPAVDVAPAAARAATRSMDAGVLDGGDRHAELLEKNRAEYERLRARFGTAGRPRSGARTNAVLAEPALTRTFRVSNINSNAFCNNYYVVSATRVYYDGKLAIYEDDATPAGLRGSDNASMATYYQKIGDQFNADMEPIIRNNFGDVLRRDAVTDNNGVMIALFTPRINNTFSGVAGFVVSCDQFPNDDASTPAVGGPYTGTGTNGTSNFGEFFYAYQPTVVGTGYSSFTPDSWYRSIRATFIHETKHVASTAARVANNVPGEASWLEESTARHSEELWARGSIYNVAWKGNTGYGSAAAPNSIYCDVRPSVSACTESNPRRPSLNMQRHFSVLYEFLGNPTGRSPFGRATGDGGSSFYATGWSLVRYSIDRYGVSDAAFLTALNESSTTGTTNLAARAGVSRERLLGGWALALFADDYAGLASPSADIQMPTWNFANIYAGLKTDFSGTYTRATPIVPQQVAFGAFAPLSVASIAGGGVQYFELSGTQAQAQLLRLTGSNGGALPSTVRVAVARLQ